MGKAMEMTDLVRAHMSTPVGMAFYDSLDRVHSDIHLIGYWSVIERAWKEMELDGVVCLDGRPVLYLKENGRSFAPEDRIRLQKLFWNQGVANVLVLADATSVFIYSGLARPPRDDKDREAKENALVETLDLADYALQIQGFYHALATGRYYEKSHWKFKPDQAVDEWLLGNLSDLRDKLIEGENRLEIEKAHAFIGRLLFLCYLLDRKIYSIGKPKQGQTGTMLLADNLENRTLEQGKTYLYEIFGELKDRFNGNMFDQDLDAEMQCLQPTHIEKVIQFLGGHEVKSGQRCLEFWAYNFKMIPVETISAIYQDFLRKEDSGKQRKRGAIYTPRFLAEMVVDTAIGGEREAFEWSYLDMACGSGIFLVIIFNRLANHYIHIKRRRINYVDKAKALQKILDRQIRGVEIEPTACRIACFSLYLAYLDFFDPPDIRKYIEKTGKPLPKLINYGGKPNRPQADIPVIHQYDFLNGKALVNEKFDCIIGNPPWSGRGKGQLAQKFVEKAPESLASGGVGCLLLPTKMLTNQTDAFQAEWLRRVTLEKVIQLADYRRWLFRNAKTPAFITRFINTPPQPENHKIDFVAPKFNRDGIRKGTVIVKPSTRSWIYLADVLAATKTKTAPIVWKRHLWGTPRDQKLLDLLQALPPLSNLAGAPNEKKRWIKGQGFQPYYPRRAENNSKYPKPKQNPWNLDKQYIEADQNLQMIVLKPDCLSLGEKLESLEASKKNLRRTPDEKFFIAPMVIISQGFGKVTFSDFDVLFQHSLQSIAGPREDEDLLLFLTGYLRSSLAKYFLFHTAANWGSERDKVHLFELLRIPFPLPGDEFIAPEASQIVKQVVKIIRRLRNKLDGTYTRLKAEVEREFLFDEDEKEINERLQQEWQPERKKLVDKVQKKIDHLIYQYFGLTEQEITLIEDTINVFEPSSTPANFRTSETVTLDPVDKTKIKPYASQGLKAYADTLTMTLNSWAGEEGSGYVVNAEGVLDKRTGLAMVTLGLSRKELPFKQKTPPRNLAQVIKEIHHDASTRSGSLLYERNIFVFIEEKIHIVRPNILLNWTRTAALNDAARIYGDIALAQIGSR